MDGEADNCVCVCMYVCVVCVCCMRVVCVVFVCVVFVPGMYACVVYGCINSICNLAGSLSFQLHFSARVWMSKVTVKMSFVICSCARKKGGHGKGWVVTSSYKIRP